MNEILNIIHKTIYQFFDVCEDDEEVPMSDKDKLLLEVNKAICDNLKALEQESCKDCISRESALEILDDFEEDIESGNWGTAYSKARMSMCDLPSVESKRKIGYCKGCKYFEYDSVAKVDEVPLIVAHEICKRWGNGCKTSEDGYCFLYEPQEMEVKNK